MKKLFNKADGVMNTGDFSKKDIDSIKSVMDEVQNMEKSKLQHHAKDLAKKIKEYSNNK